MQHIVARIKNVTRIVEHSKAEIVLEKRQKHGREPKFQVVDKEPTASHRKSRVQIARSRLIQPEPSQRVAASQEEALR